MISELNRPEQSRLLETLVTHMKTEVGSHTQNTNHWEDFSQALKPLGLTDSHRDALTFWATAQSRKAKRGHSKVRLLHSMEAVLITPESYGYLLELCEIGVLQNTDLDPILDEAAESPNLPLKQEHVKNLVLQFLVRFFSNYNPTASH